jgi:DNA-dependent RNA polymerase auxiliary subunit epsilon
MATNAPVRMNTSSLVLECMAVQSMRPLVSLDSGECYDASPLTTLRMTSRNAASV